MYLVVFFLQHQRSKLIAEKKNFCALNPILAFCVAFTHHHQQEQQKSQQTHVDWIAKWTAEAKQHTTISAKEKTQKERNKEVRYFED